MSAAGSDLIWELGEDSRNEILRGGDPDPDGGCVLYWMQRAQRAIDNPALSAAIELANQLHQPVAVAFAILDRHPVANLRHYSFMFEGLADTAARLRARHLGWILLISESASPIGTIARFCATLKPSVMVLDQNPLQTSNRWRREVLRHWRGPVVAVDADVVVPSILMNKEQFAARTIRPRIRAQLARYLKPREEPTVHVPWRGRLSSPHPDGNLLARLRIDRSVSPATEFRGGSTEALKVLDRFIASGLDRYSELRNHPEFDGTSRLSPYLHFGHISSLTVALAVTDAKHAAEKSRETFLEELIVRRELAINFVRFNQNYDRFAGMEPWARRTLDEHRKDRRVLQYSESHLEFAETADPLWNAAQRQMTSSGWMHNYMRMYWAKKILEWSPSPEAAFATAIRLNDRYEIDGRDPNGYAGIAWAIGGKHDRAWSERAVFGKIRYMSQTSTGRKFNSRAYIERWTSRS